MAKAIKHILLLIFLGALTACAQSGSSSVGRETASQEYILGSGDALRILIYGQQELSGEFTIDPSGRISVPLIKDIHAAGLTVTELEAAITAQLKPKYLKDPKVSVQVLEYRGVYILGEVRTPGKYSYIPNMTTLQAVALAGGYTYRANEESVDVTRQDNNLLKTFKIDMTATVNPGDTIVIKRRWF